MFSLARRWPYL